VETKVRTPHEVFFMPQRLLVPLFQRPYVRPGAATRLRASRLLALLTAPLRAYSKQSTEARQTAACGGPAYWPPPARGRVVRHTYGGGK